MLILVAEDESLIRLGLKSMLESLGHQVIAATNGSEAIRMAETRRPDLAILDIQMPYTNGLQAARAISREKPIPILILTAFSDQELIEQATDLPIQGYLVKPVQSSDLGAAIAVAVKRFDDMQALARRAAQLEMDLATRKLVDQAKGKLMQSGLTEEEAYRLIQSRARQNRQSVAAVAEAIVRTG